MAYSYNDFISAATGAGMLNQFSEDDLRIAQRNPEYGISALKLTQDLKGATTMEQQLLAQEALNQLRQTYGSTGTAVSAAPAAQNGVTVYQQALSEAAAAPAADTTPAATVGVETPSQTGQSGAQPAGSFSYDPSQDPSYAALKKSYLREGDRARADTLAQVSAATGGNPSSYAVTAAQQAGDYYSEKLADIMPTMEQNAYQKYVQEFSDALSLYQLMKDDAPDWAKERLGLDTTSSGGGGGPGKGGGTDLSWLSVIFPTGQIDSAYWEDLLALGYTAEELAAAGFSLASNNNLSLPSHSRTNDTTKPAHYVRD